MKTDSIRLPVPLFLLVAVLALVGAGAAAADRDQNDAPDAVYVDLPVGRCAESKLVMGFDYDIQQEYAGLNRTVSTRCNVDDGVDNPEDPNDDTDPDIDFDCFHAGLDMSRPNRADAIGDPVFAAADGRVVGTPSWGTQGNVVILEHSLDGVTVWSQYGHLAQVWVMVGQPVRRGQPLGTIMPWPDFPGNSHLHFETRSRLEVNDCPRVNPPNDHDCAALDYTQDQFRSCTGNGYSLIGRPGGDPQLEDWGFVDPVDVVFAHRPPYPGPVASETELTVRTAPEVVDGNEVPGRVMAPGVREPAKGFVCELAGDSVNEVWYELTTEDETTAYARTYLDAAGTSRSDVFIGEELRVGRQWEPPAATPLVDFRFGPDEADEEGGLPEVRNWADGDLPGRTEGTVELAVPYEALETFSDEGDFCDQTGEFDGADAIEVAPVTADFRGGVAIAAFLELAEVGEDAEEQVIAARWEEENEQWKLAVDDGALVFTVRLASGGDQDVSFGLPPQVCKEEGEYGDPCGAAGYECDGTCADPRCVEDAGYRQWVHVAAFAGRDEQKIELYWDGARVDDEELGEGLAPSTAPIRFGDDLRGKLDDVSVWPFADPCADLDLTFVIDDTGSMGDDLAALKAAAEAIVEALRDLCVSVRIAIVTYNDPGSRLRLDFTSEASPILAAINALGASGGGDFPEHVFSGVMRALGLAWREEARRAIILMGDAPPKDPEPGTGFTLAQVIAAARGEGVELLRAGEAPGTKAAGDVAVPIYSIHIGFDAATREAFRRLAEDTGGSLFSSPTAADVVQAILDAIGDIGEANGAPDVTEAAPSVAELWPPNHKMHPVSVLGVTDPDGDPVTITITGITQDEPVSGPGKHSPDGEGVGTSEARLRAERDGGGNGRMYEIRFTAADDQGGTTPGSVRVCVRHDRGVDYACIDDGQLYDSTVP